VSGIRNSSHQKNETVSGFTICYNLNMNLVNDRVAPTGGFMNSYINSYRYTLTRYSHDIPD